MATRTSIFWTLSNIYATYSKSSGRIWCTQNNFINQVSLHPRRAILIFFSHKGSPMETKNLEKISPYNIDNMKRYDMRHIASYFEGFKAKINFSSYFHFINLHALFRHFQINLKCPSIIPFWNQLITIEQGYTFLRDFFSKSLGIKRGGP